jgi:hypothetical protein
MKISHCLNEMDHNDISICKVISSSYVDSKRTSIKLVYVFKRIKENNSKFGRVVFPDSI